MSTVPSSELVQSLLCGLDALIVLAESDDGMRLKDLAGRLHRKQPTLHNILRTLRARGFAVQNENSLAYVLGPRISELAARYAQRPLLQRIEEQLVALVEALPDATVTFTEPAGGEICLRLRASPDRPGQFQRPAGQTFGLYSSASGLATLAFASDECVQLLQQHHPLLEEAVHLWAPPERLAKYLETCRRRGAALHPFTDKSHLALAAPIYGQGGTFAGTLGVSRSAGAGEQLGKQQQRESLALLLKAARAVSAAPAPK